MITEAGLRVAEEGWVPSNDFPSGIVARQDPASGSEVAENSGVTLFISNGRPVTDTIMPSLINMSLSAARDTLRVRRFNTARLRVEYEVQPELLPDTVIEQYPDPGAPANTTGEVVLVVSRREGEDNQ
jgi:serine/threonine-protein kinase